MEYEKNIYIGFDPFDGERDMGITYKRVKVVKTRIIHLCYSEETHIIKVGSMARREIVFMDNKPYRSYTCTDCIDKILEEHGGAGEKEVAIVRTNRGKQTPNRL